MSINHKALDLAVVDEMIDRAQRGETVSVSPYDNIGMLRERILVRVRRMADLVEQCNAIQSALDRPTSAKDPK